MLKFVEIMIMSSIILQKSRELMNIKKTIKILPNLQPQKQQYF